MCISFTKKLLNCGTQQAADVLLKSAGLGNIHLVAELLATKVLTKTSVKCCKGVMEYELFKPVKQQALEVVTVTITCLLSGFINEFCLEKYI
jgi:hypothetical protein